MSTPRQAGIIDELYALQAAAESFGDQDVIGAIAALRQDVTEQWFPVLTATLLYQPRIDNWGAWFEAHTGVNPLDVQDPVGVGSAEQNALVGGDLGANARALVDDVKSSANDLADKAKKAIPWAVIVAALAGALIVLYLGRR